MEDSRGLAFFMNTIVAYRHAESLFTPAHAWDTLSGGVPFRQTIWLQAWWNQFAGKGEFLFVVVHDENDRMCGVLPLQRNGRRGWQTIADGRVCTDHVSLLTHPENRVIVAEAIADFLVENAVDPELGWDRLTFHGTLAGDPTMQMLVENLQQRSAATRISTRINSWFLACDENWESYLTTCSRRTRRRYRDMIKVFESDAPDRLAVRMAEDETGVIEAVQTLVDLHQSHWQSKGEPGTYADTGMKEFVLAAAIEAFHRDQLLLPMVVRIDPETGKEQPIAAQLNFIGEDRRLYCYSTAADYHFSDLSPGSMLNVFMLKYAHDHGCTGIDYMRGDEPYKQRLHATPIPVLDIEIAAPTLRGQINLRLRDCSSACKQFLRRRLGRAPVRTLTIGEAFDSKYCEHLPVEIEPGTNSPEDWVDDGDDSMPVILPISLAWTETSKWPQHSQET